MYKVYNALTNVDISSHRNIMLALESWLAETKKSAFCIEIKTTTKLPVKMMEKYSSWAYVAKGTVVSSHGTICLPPEFDNLRLKITTYFLNKIDTVNGNLIKCLIKQRGELCQYKLSLKNASAATRLS